MALRRPTVAVYRLYDLAEEIDVARVPAPRPRLLRGRSGAVQFEQPPAFLDLGPRTHHGWTGHLTVRLYDFGVAALSWRVALAADPGWPEFVRACLEIPELPGLQGFFEAEVAGVRARIAAALRHPVREGAAEMLVEEFTVVHLCGLDDGAPARSFLRHPDATTVLMGEARDFADEVRRDLERSTFSYTTKDLAVLTFDRVLVIDPDDVWDVPDLVEFTHAELLELAFYDRVVAGELRRIQEVLSTGRRGRVYTGLRRRLMSRHAEITDVRNRLAGALRITEDHFYAKIYRSATELYGNRELADLLANKLSVLTQAYEMISAEARHVSSTALEAGIFLLVLIEVIRAFLPH